MTSTQKISPDRPRANPHACIREAAPPPKGAAPFFIAGSPRGIPGHLEKTDSPTVRSVYNRPTATSHERVSAMYTQSLDLPGQQPASDAPADASSEQQRFD